MSDIINPRDLDPSISMYSPFLGVYYNKTGQMVDMNSGEIITKGPRYVTVLRHIL